MKVKYNSWDDFVASNDELLSCLPIGFYIEKGNLNFYIELDGKKYWCSGSECCVSDTYFNPSQEIRHQCEFDSFHVFEIGDESNAICKW